MKTITLPALLAGVAALVPVPATAAQRSPAVQPPSAAARTVTAANRTATLGPAADRFVNATQVYPFADGAIYRVITAPGHVTDITLERGEVLGAVASGDTVRWVIGDTASGTGAERQAHVLVKPSVAGLSTNLVITTDRRTYHLALTSSAAPAMASVSWTWPQDTLLAVTHASSAPAPVAPAPLGIDPERLRFGYAISGHRPAWRPVRAFDDGRQTWIEFPPAIITGEAPPLFVIDGSGKVQLVNYRMAGRFYVVDRIFDVAELRLGTKRQEIVRITRTGTGADAARGGGRS